MKNIYENKKFIITVLLLLFASPFIYILNLHADKMRDWKYWLFSFLITFLCLYMIFIISTIIQIVFIKLFGIFTIKIVSFYPFTYDGKLRFHPFKLMFNTEGFSNSLLYNLSFFIKNEKVLVKKYKQLLRIRKSSYILVYVLAFLIVGVFDIKTGLLFGLLLLSTISLSYFQYGTFWYGYDYILNRGSEYIHLYLYSSKTILFHSTNDYSLQLQNIDKEEPFLYLCVIENLLYRSIIEKSTPFKSEELLHMIHQFEDFTYHLDMDTKRQNIVRLIGWTGLLCHDKTYISLSIDLLTKSLEFLVDNTIVLISNGSVKRIQNEIKQLKEDSLTYSHLQLQQYRNVFSLYELIFVKS